MATGASLIEKWPELRKLTAKQVLDGAKRCAGEERESLLKFLLYLSEVERQGAYEYADASSLWEYLEKKLGFTVCETRLRFHTAKLLLRLPLVAEYLLDGRLSMTTLVVLKDVLTSENVRAECDAASHKSKADVEKQVAARNAPVFEFGQISSGPVPTVVAVEAPSPTSRAEASAHTISANAETPPTKPGQTFLVTNAPSKAQVKALAKGQSVLTSTLTDESKGDLDAIAELLSEIYPDKSIPKVLAWVLRTTRARLEKKRGRVAAVTATAPVAAAVPQAPGAKPYRLKKVVITQDAALAGRDRDRKFTRLAIPQWMAKAVWLRDEGRCQFVLKSGQICGSTYRCQLDHVRAVADGGANELGNLRVHCRRHNLQRARDRFGNERVQRAIERRQVRAQLQPRSAG